jgi:hypothetical protein
MYHYDTLLPGSHILVKIMYRYISLWYLATRKSHIGNDHVQVHIIMILSYQQQSHIGKDHVQVHIIMIPSYQQQSHISNEYMQALIIMIPSYQQQSHIGNGHVQVPYNYGLVWLWYLVTRKSHIGNEHVQVCIIMITSSQELSYRSNALLCSYFCNPTAHREEPFLGDHSAPNVVYENIYFSFYIITKYESDCIDSTVELVSDEMERKWPCLKRGTVLKFTWKDWRIHEHSIGIANDLVRVGIAHIPTALPLHQPVQSKRYWNVHFIHHCLLTYLIFLASRSLEHQKRCMRNYITQS